MKILKWFLMLSKRLYKKSTFVALLALIPLGVLILTFAANRESGFVKVVLAQQDCNDPVSSAIVENFLQEKSLILFTQADSRENAIAAVKEGQADAAWIFPANMQETIRDYSGENSVREPIVSVVEREQTVFTRLSREKLTAALFRHCAGARYLSFSRENVSGSEAFSDDNLMEYFNGIAINRDLFAFDNADEDSNTAEQANYLTAPVRGLLAVLICLGGVAATLLYMQDDKKGVFALVKETQRPIVSFACVMIALLNLAVVVLVALFATDLAGGVGRELLGMALYCICCALFCLLLKELLASIRLYSVMLPLLVIAMCAVCPVFFDFKKIGFAAHIFPPTYYIYLLHDSRYLLYMPMYAAGLTALLLLIRTLSNILQHSANANRYR